MAIQMPDKSILLALYEKQALRPSKAVDREYLTDHIGIPWNKIRDEISYWEQKGCIVSKESKRAGLVSLRFYLTAEGIDALKEDIQTDTETPKRTPQQQNQISALRQVLDENFDREELRTLCSDLAVDYDNLPSEGKINKARELITYLERRGRLDELVKTAMQRRPHVSWSNVFSIPYEQLAHKDKTTDETKESTGRGYEKFADIDTTQRQNIDNQQSLIEKLDATLQEFLVYLEKEKDDEHINIKRQVTELRELLRKDGLL